jgi:phosphatidylinositol glycan class N
MDASLTWLIAVGVVFHGVYVLSIFDIYFRSPLVTGLEPVAQRDLAADAPAHRLVFVVADGLRADKFFENATRAPFLRGKIEREGAWGVSHTRVPTESRPGHVAMIAGFYEDVSAVTEGWKHNTVEFDSVFNRSAHTWSFGSPDIVPMFATDVAHVDEEHYAPEMEDFGANSTDLDSWVFNRTEHLLLAARANATLRAQLEQRGVVIFLHLLGIDTFGHSKRPYSGEYLHEIEIVDSGVERIAALVDEFFGHDNRTAFIFTADHGMSDKGSHGDSERANTETPLVAWGAGVRRAAPPRTTTPPLPSQWNLDAVRRVDVNQADVAPLMAALLGLPNPTNSIGVLPVDYLSRDARAIEQLQIANLQAIYRQLHAKRDEMAAHSLLFRPFRLALLAGGDSSEAAVFDRIVQLVRAGRVQETADELLRGLHYYQTYDWPMLMTTVTLGFLGWMAYVFVRLAHEFWLPKADTARHTGDRTLFWRAFGVAAAIAGALLAVQRSPINYYAYMVFPLWFWCDALFVYSWVFAAGVRQLTLAAAVRVLACVALLELMVCGYFYRQLFGAALAAGAVAVFVRPASSPTSRWWAVSWATTAVFPFLPAKLPEITVLVCLGAIVLAVAAHRSAAALVASAALRGVLERLSLLIVVCAIIVAYTQWSLWMGFGLPLLNQIASWLILFGSAAVPLVVRASDANDLVPLSALSFGATYVLLSVNYEVLFYASVCAFLVLWVRDGHSERQRAVRGKIAWSDVFSALLYVFLTYVAFFGTGNVASISSFEISSTYRFTTVFAPFLMGVILIWKLLIPNILVAVAYACVQRAVGLSARAAFLLVMLLSEVIALNFFFLVQDSGSWLDIGVSISHFGLADFQIVVQMLLFGAAALFMSRVRESKGSGKK